MIEIIPGIQEDNFEKIEEKIRLVEPYVNWVQIDITDKTLTVNESFRDPQPFKKLKTGLFLEVHLMTIDPARVASDWAGAGFKRLIAHFESQNPQEFIRTAKRLGVEVGLAIDGPTEVAKIEPFLSQIDQVTVMMIKSGPSGQKFHPEYSDKIRFIHKNWPNLPIEVDGGINPETANLVKKAGATRLASTSFLFWKNSGRIKEAIGELKNA
ncbi:MAG: hypothetical protein Q8P89_02630 [bacterium]|nr:hypothetical protein [bacterium]